MSGRNNFYLCGCLTGSAQVNELLENIRERIQTTIFSHYPNQVLAIFVQLLTTDRDKHIRERFWRQCAGE